MNQILVLMIQIINRNQDINPENPCADAIIGQWQKILSTNPKAVSSITARRRAPFSSLAGCSGPEEMSSKTLDHLSTHYLDHPKHRIGSDLFLSVWIRGGTTVFSVKHRLLLQIALQGQCARKKGAAFLVKH